MIEKGKAFYWGTSEWPAQRIIQAIGICERNGWHKPIVEQPQYNMLHRQRFEGEYAWLFQQFGYGTTIWSPLYSGLLSGKYNSGEIPEGSRFAVEQWLGENYHKYFGEGKKEKTVAMFSAIKAIADELGCTQAQLALAWCIANKDVSVTLCGFTKIEQFHENIGALNAFAKWNPDVEKRLEAALGNMPEAEMNFRERCMIPSRRSR